tara:strand:- start:3006 stop:4358 length:1353 start_codon:yes stop_codon:yes gene_type:complete
MPSIATLNEPPKLNGVNFFAYYTFISDATSYGKDKFKYVVQVYNGLQASGTLVATLKIPANTSNYGFYNASRIANTFITNTHKDAVDSKDIHRLPVTTTAKPFSLNDGSLKTSGVRIGVEYSASATTNPTEYLNLDNDDRYYIRATQALTTGASFDFASYAIDGASDKFLTDASTTQYLRSTDFATIAFLNDNTLFSSIGITIQINAYTSAGVLTDTADLTNSNANGGAIPNSEVNTDAERLIYLGVGVQNLKTQTLDATLASKMALSTTAYYTVQALDGSSNAVSQLYKFIVLDRAQSGNDNFLANHCKHTNYRVTWLNSLGAWDYFTFTGKSVEKYDVKKEESKRAIGTFSSTSFSYNNWDKGKTIDSANVTKKLTLNSGYLPAEQISYLKNLITSPEVYLIGTDTVPVVITSNSFTTKTSVNDKAKIQYTIKLEYANEEPNNTLIPW